MIGPELNPRRRVIRTTVVSGWAGTTTVTAELPSNVGLAQHQIYIASNGAAPTSGLITVSVRPAKAGFFVPAGTIDLTRGGSGQLLLPAVIDGIQLAPTTPAASGTYEAGVVSVNDDFTASHDPNTDDRRRFGMTMLTSAWNGSGSVSVECADQSGFTQHQIALTGGTGVAQLFGRPVGASAFVNIDYGTAALNTAGALAIFPGFYDAYRLTAVGTVTGSIRAQCIAVGEELFFTPYPRRVITGAKAGNTALTNLLAALAADNLILDQTT
jgi:hypothetical protein